MEKSRVERLKKVTIFSRRLKELRNRKGITTAELASLLGFSVSYTSSLINGSRAPSSDVLCAISAAFDDVSFEDVVYYLVDEDNFKVDDNGFRYILIWKMNNGRGPTAGVLKKVTEQELMGYYRTEYEKSKFFCFLKRYIAEELYRGVYEDYLKNRVPKLDMMQAVQNKMLTNPLFKDIIELLYPMDEDDLTFIKDQTELYIKRMKKNS